MIKLSNGLEAISSFIDKKDISLDVGCDHALLDIYLSNKYNKKYYASDIRESALNMARANIEKYRCNKVEIRCGSGLEVLNKEDDINTIIISGMGYMTILKILKGIKNKKNIEKLVIQSNSNPEIIRKFLLENGFYLDKELLVKDKNIYYIISSYKRGKKTYSKVDKEIGIFETNIEYLKLEIKRNKILLSIIPKKNILRRIKIKQRIKLLNKKINTK